MTPSAAEIVLAPPHVRVARADLRFVGTRSRGPGGQAVNKLSTAVQLRVPLSAIRGLSSAAVARLREAAGRRLNRRGVLVIGADTHRSQARNREACLSRLAALVRRAAREPRQRTASRPTRGSVQRRLDAKRRRSDVKGRRTRPPGE
jgi:ribosome-associated protein